MKNNLSKVLKSAVVRMMSSTVVQSPTSSSSSSASKKNINRGRWNKEEVRDLPEKCLKMEQRSQAEVNNIIFRMRS